MKKDNSFLVFQKLENKSIETRIYTRVKDISLPGEELEEDKVRKKRENALNLVLEYSN